MDDRQQEPTPECRSPNCDPDECARGCWMKGSTIEASDMPEIRSAKLEQPHVPSRAVPDEEPTLDEIKARRAAITGAPWWQGDGTPENFHYGEGTVFCGFDDGDGDRRVLWQCNFNFPHAADAAFVASAPSDIDWLVEYCAALRSESEAVKAERATAIEAMLKTLHESSSDYEAALESARSESEALRSDKERLEAKVASLEGELKQWQEVADQRNELRQMIEQRGGRWLSTQEFSASAIAAIRACGPDRWKQLGSLAWIWCPDDVPSPRTSDLRAKVDAARSTLGIEGTKADE